MIASKLTEVVLLKSEPGYSFDLIIFWFILIVARNQLTIQSAWLSLIDTIIRISLKKILMAFQPVGAKTKKKHQRCQQKVALPFVRLNKSQNDDVHRNNQLKSAIKCNAVVRHVRVVRINILASFLSCHKKIYFWSSVEWMNGIVGHYLFYWSIPFCPLDR